MKGGDLAETAEELTAFAVYSGVAGWHHPLMSEDTARKILSEVRSLRNLVWIVFICLAVAIYYR